MDSISPQIFYVYTLTNSLTEQVFYVGKGTGDRICVHEAEARKGIQSCKCSLIRQIWEQGGKVIREKVYETPIEQDAFIYEWCLINLIYGRDSLTNFWEGGNGGVVRQKKLYKLVGLSLSQKTLDLIDESASHTRAELIRQVIQANDLSALIHHPAIPLMLQAKPRYTYGLQLPLDLVARLQVLPLRFRSPIIEYLVWIECGRVHLIEELIKASLQWKYR